jgi:hypothetical protein
LIRIILLVTILATISGPAAAFKMFGPGGQYMNSTETEEERATREAQDKYYRESAREAQEATARIANMKPKQKRYTRDELLQGKPAPCQTVAPRDKYNDGPAPGGHRRHAWREKTGFNTPAERTRYENEVRRLRRELKKERARPNPAGSPPPKL